MSQDPLDTFNDRKWSGRSFSIPQHYTGHSGVKVHVIDFTTGDTLIEFGDVVAEHRYMLLPTDVLRDQA